MAALNGIRRPRPACLLAELAAVVQGVVGGVIDISVSPRWESQRASW
ncbi:hypothetical protein [Catenulispora acidiphila]|nr:hypothetical protein [Catenulispora acidiphila]